MTSAKTAVALSSVMLLASALAGCERHTKLEQYVLDQALEMVRSQDRSGERTKIEAASLHKDRKSICGYATIGQRKHLPFIIRYSNALPKGGFATVDVVWIKPPYKGAPYESPAHQSTRILAECWQLGHHLPPATS